MPLSFGQLFISYILPFNNTLAMNPTPVHMRIKYSYLCLLQYYRKETLLKKGGRTFESVYFFELLH